MLTFLTLFLGLVSGLRKVDVAVGDAVAAVEIRLDDRTVGCLTGPPWSVNVDFDETPKPHELAAIAFDKDGKEIAKVFQKINLPRSLAGARLLLLPGTGGKGRFARLSWQCAVAATPSRTSVSFDGKALSPIADPDRIPLPDYVPEQLHFLRAELDFPRNITAAAEITFGGQSRDETQAELTAVAVLADAKGKLGRLDGFFTARGAPARVAAVEEDGPGEIAFVLDEAARPTLATVAALSAVARNRARAVVLVLGGSPDASRLSPGGARGYLARASTSRRTSSFPLRLRA